MTDHRLRQSACLGAVLLASALVVGSAVVRADEAELRVCADPNNLPFSNAAGEGFENKLAELVAKHSGRKLTYTWWAQRRGWFRNTLKAGTCDVVMGVPAALDMVLATQPYYRSTYVFVYRVDHHLDLSSIKDPRLHDLTIGVHLIGDDGYNTPPAHVLGEEGIIQNVKGYPIYGDYREANPPARVVEAVETGALDVAAVWGPLGGYAALHSRVPLKVVPITDTESFAPFAFQYDVAMGVRKKDRALKTELDGVITRNATEIRALLASYGVPIVEDTSGASR